MLQPDTIITVTETSLLRLLQISGTTFPVGGFSHSYGLETYIDQGRVTNAQDLEIFIHSMLNASLGRVDTPAAALAWQTSPSQIEELDILVSALKPAKELRDSAERMGRAFLRIFSEMYPDSPQKKYLDGLKDSEMPANYPVMFGWACGYLHFDRQLTALSYLFSSVNALVQAGIKLIPLGQSEGQKLIQRLYPQLILCTHRAVSASPKELYCFSPAFDISAMIHEDLYARLYMS